MRRADMMLNSEEQRLLNSFERGEWISKPDMAARKALLEKAAFLAPTLSVYLAAPAASGALGIPTLERKNQK